MTRPYQATDPDAGLHKTVLFQSRHGGYHSYRIPGVVATAGAILVFCEGRRDTPWDTGPIDILLRRSLDAGEHWTAPRLLVDGQGQTAHSPVMIADPASPDVHFLYCREYRRCYYAKSTDAGITFTPPTEITDVLLDYRRVYPWTLASTTPGHGVRLRSGRLLVPVWFSTSRDQRPTMASVIYSDDDGGCWQRGPVIVRDGDGQGIVNPMEPVAVELPDGHVLMNIRNASPAQRRAVTISPDGVHDWTPCRFDAQLREPFCLGSICRWPLQPAILWANPDNVLSSDQPGTAEVGGADRKCLTVKVSYDAGKTWPVSRVLESGWSGYSDLAVAGATIYCLYECGCLDNLMWEIREICLARFEHAALILC